MSSPLQHKTSKIKVPIQTFPHICVGGLSGVPGDVTHKNNRQAKRGTCYIKLKSFPSM
ncbi:MAG: hypothetical protein J7K40_02405 [candidate division Zixibacteria bacterium]|nr:hypothetical protein [candidate division Zixibacteria bacterium]